MALRAVIALADIVASLSHAEKMRAEPPGAAPLPMCWA